ncbi:MAG TPA: helix-turn-helix domain-containing protein [Acidimicrobiales bacterium]
MRPATGTTLRDAARQYSPAQRKTIQAALELYAERGVGGTSLQMIADAVGVTKAAIYHQFKTKEAITVAVVTVELQQLEAALEEAEAAGSSPAAREALLDHIIGIAVERRAAVATLQTDPMIVPFLLEHERFRHLWPRLYLALLGDRLDESALVRTAVLAAAISGAVAHPFARGIDDATLKTELLAIARRLVFGDDD